ncbi:integrase arm-type DNA-binding domain-containing protein [Bradyrhizobium sp. URHD0069]|uniref:tyrosine-type recombinase/integrase n=1 Tax=Bradyrhizobium sp. URHD0069 TaxID=1380355 RepID=UPI0004975DA8|nr:integrase arm-type DNA-binding domain-containing protein [Bradyrhizobium sp. URHD0069]
MKRITDAHLRNLKPKAKPYRYTIGGGLYLLIKPNGSMLWRYDYKLGTRKTLALGEYPKKTLGVALDALEMARANVKAGIDPVEQKQAATVAAAAPRPFGEVADEWLATRPGKPEKSKTFARDERMVGYLTDGKGPAGGFAKVAIDQVRVAHLSPLLKAVNKPTRIRLQSAARKIMGYAKAHGMIEHSPFSDINFEEGFAKHKEQHRPAITDPVKFGVLLRKIEAFEGRGDNLTGYALELLALTFVRPGTVQAAEWSHFNLKSGFWVVPFKELKMATQREEAGYSEDDYVIPLSHQAVALLRELQKITGDEQYLFPGRSGRTISENTLNYALHSMGYKGIHCAHGFRSSASTILNRERINGRRRFERELIEMQQDRLDKATRAVYDRDDRLPERIELMQCWADKLDALRAGGEVVKLPVKSTVRR